MLILDEQKQATHAKINYAQEALSQFDKEQFERMVDAVYMDELVTHPEKAGKPMKTEDFETKLKKLIPNIVIERFPQHNADSKNVSCRLPNGTRIVYPFPIIFERSVRNVIYTYRILPGVIASDPQQKTMITRADLPKHKVIPARFDENDNLLELGRIEWEEGAIPAGTELVKLPGGEKMRGYRTVLAILVREGLITPTEVENEFGSINTKEWANHMGKQVTQMPW